MSSIYEEIQFKVLLKTKLYNLLLSSVAWNELQGLNISKFYSEHKRLACFLREGGKLKPKMHFHTFPFNRVNAKDKRRNV